MQHGRKGSFKAVLTSVPQVLSQLKPRDLLCLASTSHCCKEAVTFAVIEKALDVSMGQESAPISCRFTLADLAALLRHFAPTQCQ